MKKRLIGVLALVALCGTFGFANGSSEGGSAAGSSTKPVELSLWSGYPEMAPFYKKAAEDYKALHPNVNVTVVTYPLREFEQKLSATVPSNTASDIFEISDQICRKFIEAGLIEKAPQDVVDYIDAPNRYSDFVKSKVRGGDDYYGVPIFEGRTALYYNTKMFKEAGIAEPPKTFDEMYEDAKKLAKYDANGDLIRAGHSLRLSGQGSGIAEKFWFVLYPMGGDIIVESEPGKYHAGYNNEGGRKALTYYLDAIYKDKWDSPNLKHDAEGFELELSAMFFRESWVIGDIAKNAPKLEYATAYVPRDVRWGRITNLESLYIPTSCKNKEIAWDFCKFLTSEENLQWLLDNVGWLPSRHDIDLSAIVEKKPQFKAFIGTEPGYEEYGYSSTPAFDELLTKLAERLAAAYLDSSLQGNPQKIADYLDMCAKETNSVLESYGVYDGK